MRPRRLPNSLYERLKNNDFRHVEDWIDSTEAKLDRGLAEAHTDRDSMESRLSGRIERVEARIGERLGRAGQDRRDMEARILAAVQQRPDTDEDESGP